MNVVHEMNGERIIYSKKKSNLVMRLQDKGNRHVLNDKGTDQNKAQEQIDRSLFKTLDHNPTRNHIKIVSE